MSDVSNETETRLLVSYTSRSRACGATAATVKAKVMYRMDAEVTTCDRTGLKTRKVLRCECTWANHTLSRAAPTHGTFNMNHM